MGAFGDPLHRLKVNEGTDLAFALAPVVIGPFACVGEVVEAVIASAVICVILLFTSSRWFEGPLAKKTDEADAE